MRRRKIAGTEEGTPEKYRRKSVAEFIAEHPELEPEEDTRTDEEREREDDAAYDELVEAMRHPVPISRTDGKISY